MRLAALLSTALIACVSSDVSRELGARCEDSDECDDRCLTGTQFPDGMCTTTCDTSGDCPSAADCADLAGGVCLFACHDDADCEFLGAGWRCLVQVEHGAPPDTEVMVCAAPP